MDGGDPQFPAEEDVAPRANADGEVLTFAQKSAILQDAASQKKAAKEEAQKFLDAKKKASLGIAKGKPVADNSASSTPASSSRAAGAGVKAALALSPDGKKKADAGSSSGASPAGGGAKAALALKGKAGGKAGAGAAKKGGVKKKAGGLIAAAKEEAAAEAAQAAQAPAPAAASPETEEEREARLKKEEEEREAERERRHREREEQRREIEIEIIAEERRVREKERKKREKLAAELKLQRAFRDAAFDGDMDVIRKTIDKWVEECAGTKLIGAKVDAADEHKHTALSEAACGGQADVCKVLLEHGASVNAGNAQGRTPLWRAAFMDKRDCVKLLLESGGVRRHCLSTPLNPSQPIASLRRKPPGCRAVRPVLLRCVPALLLAHAPD